MIDYGYLMMLVDSDNRYVYKGSVTTPPCGQSVYWNVMSTVYPIKQAHVDLFKAQLARADQGDLADTGNWREIQTVDEHNVIRVTTEGTAACAAVPAAVPAVVPAAVPADETEAEEEEEEEEVVEEASNLFILCACGSFCFIFWGTFSYYKFLKPYI
jgi:hypothetical protein